MSSLHNAVTKEFPGETVLAWSTREVGFTPSYKRVGLNKAKEVSEVWIWRCISGTESEAIAQDRRFMFQKNRRERWKGRLESESTATNTWRINFSLILYLM